jgi:hypothetical protein
MRDTVGHAATLAPVAGYQPQFWYDTGAGRQLSTMPIADAPTCSRRSATAGSICGKQQLFALSWRQLDGWPRRQDCTARKLT